MIKRILIIGATSAIATACAQHWAHEDKNIFFLVARNSERLTQVANDLMVRGAKQVTSYILDVNNIQDQQIMLKSCMATLGNIDIVLIAHGTLSDQNACEKSVELTLQELQTNALSTIALLTRIPPLMLPQQDGVIAVISSVAGDRGRASNYIYSTAKAAVTTFCEGLRARLCKHNIQVLTIKPGFVDTPMTQNLPIPSFLTAKPETIATQIARAIKKRKNTIYTPKFWGLIMSVIKFIPTSIFKRISL